MKHLPWLGQWLAAIIVAIGIGVEIAMGADAGFIVITVGSLIFVMATKLRRRD